MKNKQLQKYFQYQYNMYWIAIFVLLLLLLFEINRQKECYRDNKNSEKKWFKRNNILY